MTVLSIPIGEVGSVGTAVLRSREKLHAYGLLRPDLVEARAAIERVCGDRAEQIWASALALAARSGESAPAGDPAAGPELAAVVEALAGLGDPVVALCARALAIRLHSFEHLATTQDLVRSVQA